MSIQDFIVIYNETFKYIVKKYGRKYLNDFWNTVSEEWCTHLKELVDKKGVNGALEYWGGNKGTLSREKAVFNTYVKDGTFYGFMNECPSVAELKNRKRKLFIDYCCHCMALYGPVASANNLDTKWHIDRDKDGYPSGSCSWTIGTKNKKE